MEDKVSGVKVLEHKGLEIKELEHKGLELNRDRIGRIPIACLCLRR